MSEELNSEPVHEDVRSYLAEELRIDLMGPSAPDEELTDRPTIRYLTGILYPSQMRVIPEEDDEGAEASLDDDDLDIGSLMALTFYPSSLGITVQVEKNRPVIVRTEAATYKPVYEDDEFPIWKREVLELPEVEFSASEPGVSRQELANGLDLFIRSRDRDDHMVVTVSIINTHEVGDEYDGVDGFCFFQPGIELRSAGDEEGIFLSRSIEAFSLLDEDRRLNELLFRHTKEFAVGHGCAAEWDLADTGKASKIHSSIIPAHEVHQITPDIHTDLNALEMRFLSEADVTELRDALREIPGRYLEWIDTQKELLADIPADLLETAQRNIHFFEDAAQKISAGIDLVEQDPNVLQAFQLANKAMLEQRARSVWISTVEDQRPNEIDRSGIHRWRLFQLAFILFCLPSITDPTDPDRKVVDLLWFPTGGGKTEAYLGLTAFTIFLRRIRNADKKFTAGVVVLMRYTLRLLTIQQFQRAATLILACENIRRGIPDELGNEEISLGLWVGAGATPNKLSEARNSLRKHRSDEDVYEKDPCQLRFCPWCGTTIRFRDYEVSSKLLIKCPGEKCDFSDGLSLYVVDEDIYRHQPAMIIGTVDKFARLPWVEEASSLFGKGAVLRKPPELIIQDELHLISGPLGTMVGLYETAVDALSEFDGVGPKIIASTATIRRAGQQAQALFARGLNQFPPPGIDARDNFFSNQVPYEHQAGRLFLGVHAPGKSMKMALLRIYALLLQKISSHESTETLRDPFWTLVGYFNSLRELGGARRLVDDDVREQIKRIAQFDGHDQRFLDAVRELTSRVPSPEIPDILKQMERELGEGGALDVLLASNMISVGVDVDRLSVMVVGGQPKTTSEYIQATSRIGRKYPGLVVTLYKATRPRDRSHFERFTSYHQTLYSQVEPTSVTPFSSRARDRGLHGVFVTLARHLIPGLRPDDRAGDFDPEHPQLKEIVSNIVDRVNSVDPDESDATLAQTRGIIEIWDRLARADKLLYRRSIRDRHLPYLMESASGGASSDFYGFATLNSLRSVEGESQLKFLPEDL